MRGPWGRFGVVLVMLLPVIGLLTAPVGGAEPVSIELTVNDEAASDGEQVLVTSNPHVGMDVSANATIRTVTLRLNGDTVETFEVDSTTFSETYIPELEDGRNEFRVIVDTADGVGSRTLTLTKDDRGPFVRFTSPFTTSHHREVVPGSTQVGDSYVTLSGELVDTAGVSHMTITREFTYTHANTEHFAEDRWDIEDPGDAFSQEIFLGSGSNDIRVTVEDHLGQSRTYDFELDVVDEERPAVSLDLPNRTRDDQLQITGTASDNVQVDTVSVHVPGVVSSKHLFDGIDKEPDESAVSVALSGMVTLRPGENPIEVTATDFAGNSVTVTETVVLDTSIEPEVRIDREGTRFESGQQLHVSAVVEYGEISRVTLEAIDVATEEPVDFATIYSGSAVRHTVAIDRSVDLADGRTRLVIRATDSSGTEHQSAFEVDPSTGTLPWGQASTDDGTDGGSADREETATPTETDGGDSATPTATTTAPSTTTGTATATETETTAAVSNPPGGGPPGVTLVGGLLVGLLAVLDAARGPSLRSSYATLTSIRRRE